MSYTVTQLITRAYYLSAVVPRGLKTVTGDQLTEGLYLLNELLDFKTADQRLIPYFKQYDFDAVDGQGTYFIQNLVFSETLTFYIGDVRYPMYPEGRRDFQGSAQAENVTSLPYKWHMERCKGGANLFIYFRPNTNYPMTLWGKFSLTDVTLNEDLSAIYDSYYIAYMRYGLAKYICQEYGVSFPTSCQQQLQEFENLLIDIGPMDLSLVKRTIFATKNNLNYAIANLSNGFI